METYSKSSPQADNMFPRGMLAAIFVIISLTAGNIQGLRIVSDVDAVELDALENAGAFEGVSTQPTSSLETSESLVDLNQIIHEYNGTNSSSMTWRAGRKLTEALNYMLNTSKLTDCTFVVGPDGQTETIEAHAVILAAASPVFEAAFENGTTFRISDWLPSDFNKMLRFIYSGDLCFNDFEEACTILKLASSLELAGANDAAREYISNYMFPNRLWQAFQCANEAHDKKLSETVMKVISSHTSKAMNDQKFSEVSRDYISMLLQRDDLAVTSEVELFKAVTRWGLKQVTKANQKPTPELIRQALGPAIIKSIRFLTMSGAEFSQIHLSSRILDYEEGLAVLLYINSPGGLEMPSTLSSSTKKRQANEGAGTFYSFAPDSGKCNKDSKKDSTNYPISDLYTTTIIPNSGQWKVYGIQIPKSLEARSDCSLKEHFDVLFLDSLDNVLRTESYNEVPPCETARYRFDKNSNPPVDLLDNYLISFKFNPSLTLPAPKNKADRYKIKIVFHEKREYPRWVDGGDGTISSSDKEYSIRDRIHSEAFQVRGYSKVLHSRPFLYSLFTE